MYHIFPDHLISFQAYQVRLNLLKQNPRSGLLKVRFRIQLQATFVALLQVRLCQRFLSRRSSCVKGNLHCPPSIARHSCNRARLYSKRIRSHRRADEESDLPVPEAFGQQVACDHMIVSKPSSGKEFVVLVVMDLFSKVFQAYPLATKDTDSVKVALKPFCGCKGQEPSNHL